MYIVGTVGCHVHGAVEMAGWRVVGRYLKHKNDADDGSLT